MALVFYYKDMLEKVTMQGTQQFSAFVCYRRNPKEPEGTHSRPQTSSLLRMTDGEKS